MANEVSKATKQGIASYLGTEAIRQNVEKVVGSKDAQRFISSVVSATQSNPMIADCTNSSILSAALLGHSLNLPQSPQLSYFYMVPFNNTKKVKGEDGREHEVTVKEAVFQLGYRGYIQLAMRSGQYQKIVAADVREGELKSFNPITEEIVFEPILNYEEREQKPIIGYYGYFTLTNGFKKEIFWDKTRMENHAKRYSMSYRKGWSSSLWKSDFDDMARKTIIRQLISKWGIMSVDLEKAYESDMAVIREDGTPDYIDNIVDEPTPAVDVYADVQANEVIENEEKSE